MQRKRSGNNVNTVEYRSVVLTTGVKTPRSKNFVFPEILHVFYGILTFFCITFDALQMRLIVTDVVVTLTLIFYQCFFFRRLISEVAERNSTKIGHMVGSKCNLKTHVQSL